jgi:hypothetical protein
MFLSIHIFVGEKISFFGGIPPYNVDDFPRFVPSTGLFHVVSSHYK